MDARSVKEVLGAPAMTGDTPLPTIIALARAGALDHAWARFSAAGYDRDDADPAALTVKGRLLKDHGLRAARARAMMVESGVAVSIATRSYTRTAQMPNRCR